MAVLDLPLGKEWRVGRGSPGNSIDVDTEDILSGPHGVGERRWISNQAD